MEISGHEYAFGKLSAMTQWNVLRRIAPAMVGVLGMANLKGVASGEEGFDVRDLIDRIEPFLAAMANLSDEDSKRVIDACLSVVTRKQEGDRGWASVGTSDMLMFQDIDLLVMMRLVFEAGRENLLGFFAAFQQMYPGLLAAPEPQPSLQ